MSQPKVSVCRTRRVGIARPELASKQTTGKRLARVFGLKHLSPVDEASAIGVETGEMVAGERSVPAPRQASPEPQAEHPKEREATGLFAAATPRGPQRRRVPNFKRPGAVVVIKPAGDDVPAASGQQAQEHAAKEPHLAEMAEQLATLAFTTHPKRFVFDLSPPSRWDEVGRARLPSLNILLV